VEYVTKFELREFAESMPINEQASIRRSASLRSPSGSIFLSHSSKDVDITIGAIQILENHGAKVYVDEIDPEMPPYTSAETAAKLKSRIKESKRFVMLASEASKDSRWVPWELGIADGYRGLSQIALFPAVDDAAHTGWTSWEYLGLYRRIVWGIIKGSDPAWIVWNEDENSAIPLKRWLSGQ
jgi:hypothetical protein